MSQSEQELDTDVIHGLQVFCDGEVVVGKLFDLKRILQLKPTVNRLQLRRSLGRLTRAEPEQRLQVTELTGGKLKITMVVRHVFVP